MKRFIFIYLAAFLLASCEHQGQSITEFTGDYRYYAGIAEFFECKEHVKYYVSDSGASEALKKMYLALDIKDKDDVYIKVKGYLKEEKQMEGINPKVVFVVVDLIEHDMSRGCVHGIRQGY